MAAIIEEFAGLVGWEVDDSELADNQELVDRTAQSYTSFSRVLKVVATALAGAFAIGLNKTTAEMDALAKSVFVATDTIAAIAQVTEIAGFTFESVIDLAEELNNKLGESKGVKEMTAVKEATKILGLTFEDLNKQSPEKQFIAVLNAAKNLEDQQKAVAAADILLGAEANRIVGVLRQEEGTIEDVIKRFKELNFLTDEGRKGATEFTKETGKLTTSIGSLGRQIFGLIGQALVPLLKSFNELIANNKELISKALLTFFENLNSILIVTAGAMGVLFLLRLPALFLTISTAVSTMAAAFFAFNVSALLIPALIAAAAIAVGLLIEDLVVFFQGGDSALGRLLDRFPMIKTAAIALGDVFKEVARIIVVGFTKTVDDIVALFSFILDIPNQIVKAFESIDFKALIPDFVQDFLGEITVTDFPAATQAVAQEQRRLFIPRSEELEEQPLLTPRSEELAAMLPAADQPINVGPLTPGATLLPQSGLTSTTNAPTSIEQNIDAPIIIQQMPGESAEDLASRVSGSLGKEVANAVRQLDNGIER